jgi:hypothetical protein
MVTWISDSPHTGLSAEVLRDLQKKDEAHVGNGNERVQSLVNYPGLKSGACPCTTQPGVADAVIYPQIFALATCAAQR